MKRRTLAYALLLSTAAAGTAWAFGGPPGDCPRGGAGGGPGGGPMGGMPPMERMPMEGPEGREPFADAMKVLSPEQRQAARELLDQGRAEGIELRRRMSNERFELMKLGLAKEWNAEAAREHTRKLAEAMAEQELQRAELRHKMRALTEEKP